MARFVINDGLSAGLAELAKFNDEQKWQILSKGAEIIKEAHIKEIKARFVEHTGSLANSPTIVKKYIDGELVARIQPQGKHKGTKIGIRRRKSRAIAGIKGAKHGRDMRTGSYEGSNAEIAYYLNYGTPRITPPTHWMEHANEKAEAAVLDAMQEAWDKHIEDIGL